VARLSVKMIILSIVRAKAREELFRRPETGHQPMSGVDC
jgi:hypothetical protein